MAFAKPDPEPPAGVRLASEWAGGSAASREPLRSSCSAAHPNFFRMIVPSMAAYQTRPTVVFLSLGWLVQPELYDLSWVLAAILTRENLFSLVKRRLLPSRQPPGCRDR
jgi:hypothetical protein